MTRLELHGFKSFASKTVFAFEPGITAVVGPNGSGKSNISDAIRWVLGETSYSALRSKKTEDVIFAGGKGKAPSGLAEVTVTFDNEDRWLPSEFSEVTVTRRAFRGGDTQYFINGRRVRLKDVAQLTASLGHSYTVVGQGLVDQALSQRAEERRGLFEHAADLTGLRLKVQEAERNLAESDTNITRLTDLLAEVEPNLKRLERAARQAREYKGLHDRLVGLQRGHYRRLLVAAHEDLAVAEREAGSDETAWLDAQTSLESLIAERVALQEAQREAADALATHDARLETLREQHRRLSHERDLLDERQSALKRRRADMRDTQEGLDEQMRGVESRLAAANDAVEEIRAAVDSARTHAASLREAVSAARSSRIEQEQRANDLQRTITRNERRANELEQRRALLLQRRESSDAEHDRIGRESADRAERIAGFEQELAAFEAEDQRIVDAASALETRLAEIQIALDAHQASSRDAVAKLAEIDRAHGQATNRLDVLQRVHESGTGLHAGVRQVMQWQRDGQLRGIRGTLQELIAVDRAFDTALEVALGGHLQDIVVDAWRDADAAIQMLKRARAGRATFQPIETVRQRDRQRPVPREIEGVSGVHGVASDLVDSDADVAVVVRALLGRIVVVDDLPTARRLLGDLPGGWSTVTLAGEIARSGGSVTGGSAVRESGVLGRERELRELPDRITKLERERAAARAAQDDIAGKTRALLDTRSVTESERAGLVAQKRERGGQRDRLLNWLRDLRKEQDAADKRASSVETSRAEREQELTRLSSDLETILAATIELRHEHERVRKTLQAERDGAADEEQALAAGNQELATLEERLRAEERHLGSLTSQRQGLSQEREHRVRRATELEGEWQTLSSQRDEIVEQVDALTASLATATDERQPLHDALAVAGQAVQKHDEAIERSRREVMERERRVGQRGLAVERAKSHLTAIHQRITDDLDYEDPDDLLRDEVDVRRSGSCDGDTPRSGVTATSSDPVDLPDDHDIAERDIQKLRDRLRRVGYVSDDAVEEYERESERHAFLQTQLSDVQQAATSLREMLAELHETMSQRFEETFARVAEEFSKSFTVLFGGGTARLVLTADDEGAPGGIDIVAQPPGKRLQGLALLSGGERSLTAVALLFAILRVNPSPFVLLDEVDAALDEANVVRFRDELRTLADETQAIVITHNRGTVEIADTLYGVTMGGDGVSQVLSLRLSELPLDDDIDVRDLPAVSAGLPVR
ncbi:MAG TPA: chromosome segregation protein SMC [Thermomicrobiales bacterium]|nr:chromosome segregation protein SMC [Thermomicrobiales bacterium]